MDLLHGHRLKKSLHGTHRSIDPAETWDRVRPLAGEMGITRIGELTGLDRIGIPVATAVRPNARNLSVTLGKGVSSYQALTSALMEACELFHAEDVGPFRRISYRGLRATENVVDLGTLHLGNRPLNLEDPLRWVEGFDLQQQRPCWVPAEVVEVDYARPQPTGYFLMGYNGLASGNLLVEAVNSALYELIERDALALWAIKPIHDRLRCIVDLSLVNDEACCILLQKFTSANIAVSVYNITTDVGIAAFLCEIRDLEPSDPTRLSRFHGAGCHVDRRVALAHALLEAAQSLLTYTAGLRDDLSPEHFREEPDAALRNALLDALSKELQPTVFSDIPNFVEDDLHRDLRWTLARLSMAGLDRAIAVDMTRERFGIPVVRVIVPGLEWEPHHPDYRPGVRARALAPGTATPFALRKPSSWHYKADVRHRRGSIVQGAKYIAGVHDAIRLGAKAVLRRASRPLSRWPHTPIRVVVFVGSTLPRDARPVHEEIWEWRPPAKYGDIFRAALTAPDAIGIIDGYFESVPAALVGEFLWAMAQGIHVFGAASIGALRAVELGAFGMRGVGKIYDDYCKQPYTDDEEIAVTEAPINDYLPSAAMVDPMVDVRATLQAAAQQHVLTADIAFALAKIAKSIPYKERTFKALLRHAHSHHLPAAKLDDFEKWLSTNRVFQKRLDAEAMLAEIRLHLAADRRPLCVNYEFVETTAWKYASQQMVRPIDNPFSFIR